MARSANGWTANDPTVVSRRMVPGTQVGVTVRNGAPGDLLLEVAARFDRQVQDIDNARGALDDWGYAERPIRGGTELSNHASGTAIDLNATRWPLGSKATVNLNAVQIATMWTIVAACRGVVIWGAAWSRPDPMHFELAIGSTTADCERALRAFGRPPAVKPTPSTPLGRPTLRRGSRGAAVALLQRFLGVVEPCEPGYGQFGERTEAAVRSYQAMRGLAVDGVVGPVTWSHIDSGL